MQQVSNGQLSYQNFKNNGGGSILRQQLNQIANPQSMGKKNESCSLEYTTQQNTQISYFTNINHQGQNNLSTTTLGAQNPVIIQDKENSQQPIELVGGGMSKECSLIQSVSPTDVTQEYDPLQQIPNHFTSPSLEALKKHLDMNAHTQQHLSRSSPHNNQLIFLSTSQSAASFKGQHSASSQHNNFALQTGFSPRFSNFTTVGAGEEEALMSPQKLDTRDQAYPQLIVEQETVKQEDANNFMTLGNLNSYQSVYPPSLHPGSNFPGHKHTLSMGSAHPEASAMKTAIFMENQTAQYTQANSNTHSQP